MNDYTRPPTTAMLGTGPSLHVFSQAKYIGGYRLGTGINTLTFNFTFKPSRWHRFWMRACLGFVWVDGAP